MVIVWDQVQRSFPRLFLAFPPLQHDFGVLGSDFKGSKHPGSHTDVGNPLNEETEQNISPLVDKMPKAILNQA